MEWFELAMFIVLPALLEALAVFGGIYLGLLLVLKRWPARRLPGPGAQSAPEIVRERYARGEISRSEYQRMREDLEGEAPAAGSANG